MSPAFIDPWFFPCLANGTIVPIHAVRPLRLSNREKSSCCRRSSSMSPLPVKNVSTRYRAIIIDLIDIKSLPWVSQRARHNRVFPCGALRPTTPNNQPIFSVACSRLSKRTLSESFIKSCTLSEIPVNNYWYYFPRY